MRATEGCEVRHVDAVFAEMVIGAARPVDRVDTERGDEGLGGGKALALGQDRPGLGRVAIDLIGVEQAERPGEEPPSLPPSSSSCSSSRRLISFQRTPRLACSPLRTCAPRSCH
jgi:hypothetical protein